MGHGRLQRLMQEARAGEWRNASGEHPDDVPAGGEIGGVGERSVQARFSNLPYYAAAGVKPQAFVPIVFQYVYRLSEKCK
jgi:hypothetical protein